MNKLLYIIALLLTAITADAQTTVEAKLDSVQMVIGEQTGLHISATVKQGQKVLFRKWKAQQMIAPGVEVVDVLDNDTAEASDGYIKVTQHLVLTSFIDKDTVYYIPKQTVKVDGKPYQTNNLALKIYTINVDTLHQTKFFGPKDVQDNPFLWSEWALLLWLSLAVIVLYALCILIYVRLKNKKPINLRVKIVKVIPPHKKALNKIEELKKAEKGAFGFDAADDKAYYTQLTDALRQYMQERFGFNAMEMTSSEIIERLRQEKDQKKIQELSILFETADLVKFAKYNAGINENDRNLVSAIDFINTTKQDNVPTEQRVVPTATEQERHTMRMRLSLKVTMAIMIILSTAMIAYICWQLYDLRW